MKVYIVFDGDHIGRMVGRATLADKPDEVRVLSQRIDQGNQIFRMWAQSHGGNVINIGGDEGRLEVEATRLNELPSIREQYEAAVGASCSVGVGMALSLAQKALVAAKAKGGDRIVFYSPEVDQTLAALEEQSEGEKISDEYLNKAAVGSGGMAPQRRLVGSTPGDSSEVDALMAELEGQDPSDPQPAQTQAGAAPDLQSLQNAFHKLAGQSDEKTPPPSNVSDATKQKIVGIIEFLQQHPEQLQMLKLRSPDLYNSINELVSAMIEMARKAQPVAAIQQDAQAAGTLGKRDLMPGGQGDNRPDSDFDPQILAFGVQEEMREHGLDEARAKEIVKDHLTEDPNYYQLDKAALEAGKTGRHAVILPVGTTKEPSASGSGRPIDAGKRKVQTQDGKEHWVSVRAGIVMSPGGQATSSRNPSGIKPADQEPGQQ